MHLPDVFIVKPIFVADSLAAFACTVAHQTDMGGRVPGKGTLPPAGSVASANESINGSLVLFRLKTASFENRPLVLKILGPTVPQDEATVDLDV